MAKHWIHKLKKGTLTAQAKHRGLTPAQFQQRVLDNPEDYDKATVARANARKTLVAMHGKR